MFVKILSVKPRHKYFLISFLIGLLSMMISLLSFATTTFAMTTTSTTVSTLPSFSAHSTRVLDIQHWKTTKGTPVYFVRTPGLPMLDLQVIFNAGASRDDKNFGLAQLTNALLNEGAGNLSADQISEQFDAVGAIFSADAGRDTGIVGLRSLTDPQY